MAKCGLRVCGQSWWERAALFSLCLSLPGKPCKHKVLPKLTVAYFCYFLWTSGSQCSRGWFHFSGFVCSCHTGVGRLLTLWWVRGQGCLSTSCDARTAPRHPRQSIVRACVFSPFSRVPVFVTLWTVAHQAALSWDSLSKNTGVGCQALFQGIFKIQGSNPHPLCHWQGGSLPLAPPGLSPLDCKEIKSDNPKANQYWIFIGRTGAEAPILWPPDAKSRLIWKDPDAGKDWRQEGKRTTEDEMVGWYHWLNGPEFEQALGDDEGRGSLACCGLWGRKESDMTEGLNKYKCHLGSPSRASPSTKHQGSKLRTHEEDCVLGPLIQHSLLRPRALCSQEELSPQGTAAVSSLWFNSRATFESRIWKILASQSIFSTSASSTWAQ